MKITSKKALLFFGLLVIPGSIITIPLSYLIMKATEEKTDNKDEDV